MGKHFQITSDSRNSNQNKTIPNPSRPIVVTIAIHYFISDARNSRHTVAIVGAAFSGVTMAVASLAGLFYIPVVSFASTSRLLGDRARFRYFYRTVPSDNLQARAMVDIIHTFQWTFVITVASDNEYGRSGISALKDMAQKDQSKHLCIVVDELFSRKGSKKDIIEIFSKIKQFPKAKVVIVYAEFPDAKYFLEEAKLAGLRDYVFIASDSWAGSVDVVRAMDDVISSVICLKPPTVHVPAFNAIMKQKLSSNVSKHMWTAQYKEYISNRCRASTAGSCATGIHNNGYIPYIMDAVFAIAHALHNLLKCSKDGCRRNFDQSLLRFLPAFIQNVTIKGVSNKVISFDENGSVNGAYDLYSLKIENGSYEYRQFGRWALSGLDIDRELIHWNNLHNTQPDSTCSRDCQKGEYKIPMSRYPECCWLCEKCSSRTITNSTGMRNCVECPLGTWPNANNSDCLPIEAEYLRWSDWWSICILVVSGLGVLAVFTTVVVFIKYHATAVVRAASRQLCFVLLFGICLFFVTPVVFIMKPSKISCLMLPFMIGMCFAMVVGTILIKTNRISRIFNEKLLQTGRIACLGNQWQLLLMGCLATVEVVVCLCWVRGSDVTPFPEAIYSRTSKEATLTCNLSASTIGFSVWLIYNAGLVIICTYQAFLVRKVPQNYNESRFIAFTMITICITVLVYIPSYLGTSAWYRTVISCFMFVFLGTVTWVSIFIPKLHIILFRAHKNIPMRPSVSSVTLGVFDRAPTVVSNYSDPAMRSRSSTYSSYNSRSDSVFERTDSRSSYDVCNGYLAKRDKKRSKTIPLMRFKNRGEKPFCKCGENAKLREEGPQTEDHFKSQRNCRSYIVEQKVVKKQSIVRFKDGGEVTTSPWVPNDATERPSVYRRHSDVGTLRNRYIIGNFKEPTETADKNTVIVRRTNEAKLPTSLESEDKLVECFKNSSSEYWDICNGSNSLPKDLCDKSIWQRRSTAVKEEFAETLNEIKRSVSPNSDRKSKTAIINRPTMVTIDSQTPDVRL